MGSDMLPEELVSSNSPTFHTPPVATTRSWIAEKESYGIGDPENEYFSDPLGIKKNSDESHSRMPTDLPISSDHNANTASPTKPRPSRKIVRSASSTLVTPDDASSDSVELDGTTTPTPLPPFLIKAVDQFIQSLKEPKFAAPLEPGEVSALYQDFYTYFSTKADHFLQTGGYLSTKKREIQMETYEEIAEKKRERSLRPARLLEYMEAAEARACSSVLERIYRPVVGDDVDRSKDIQRRVKALKSLPVKLKNLDFDISGSILENQSEEECEKSVSEAFALAGEEFALMQAEDSVTPRKKLEHLINGHKLVVDSLSELFPSASQKSTKASADMILPALIYTFIIFDTPDLWLSLAFITRYRNSSLLAGEPSYVLTNFQAAIGYLESVTLESMGYPDDAESLEDVDLSVLKTGVPEDRQPILDMSLHYESSTSHPATTSSLGFGKYGKGLSHRVSAPSLNSSAQQHSASKRSSMILAPTGIVTSADQAFKSIGTSFGNSYRFLLSKTSNSEKTVSSLAGSEPLLSDSHGSTSLRHSMSSASVGSAGTCSAIPPTPPVVTTSIFDAPPRELTRNETPSTAITPEPNHTPPETSNHILGRFASMSMMRTLGSSYSSPLASRPESPPGSSSPVPLKKPLDKIYHKDWESLQISEVKALHEDYKRLVDYLKSIHAFEK